MAFRYVSVAKTKGLYGSDILKVLMDNDTAINGLANKMPKGILLYDNVAGPGTTVTSNVTETTIYSETFISPGNRMYKGEMFFNGDEGITINYYIDTVLVYRHNTGADTNNEAFTGHFLLGSISAGLHTLDVKCILNAAAPPTKKYVGRFYLKDCGEYVAAS